MVYLALVVTLFVALMFLSKLVSKSSGVISMTFFFLALAVLVVGFWSYPVYQAFEAEQSIQLEAAKTQAEKHRATKMIEVLGSPDKYLRYLEAETSN